MKSAVGGQERKTRNVRSNEEGIETSPIDLDVMLGCCNSADARAKARAAREGAPPPQPLDVTGDGVPPLTPDKPAEKASRRERKCFLSNACILGALGSRFR